MVKLHCQLFEAKEMSKCKIKTLSISQINVDQKNPRLKDTSSQKQAINEMFEDQGDKIIKLASHIVKYGLNPTERLLVFKENKKYVDGDGNRRLIALKVLETPDILENGEWKKQIEKIRMTSTLPSQLECAVFNNREEAKIWISLNHKGQGQGEGRIPWDSAAKDRFNQTQSIGTQIMEKYVNKKDREKYQKTTMDRFFNYKDIKENLNIELDDKGLIDFLKINTQHTKLVVQALANIKVADVYNKEKAKAFHKDIITQNYPQQRELGRKTTRSRSTVVPKDFILRINETKANNIFGELKRINVKEFPNASAILLRAFLELTVDSYCKKKGIKIEKNRVKLLEKLKSAYTNMDLKRNQIKVLNSIVANPNDPAHTNILNSYTHNPHHNPDPESVKTAFDNLQIFFEQAYLK